MYDVSNKKQCSKMQAVIEISISILITSNVTENIIMQHLSTPHKGVLVSNIELKVCG